MSAASEGAAVGRPGQQGAAGAISRASAKAESLSKSDTARRKNILRRLASFLPLGLILAHACEYQFWPNFPKYAANRIAYPISEAYLVFLGVLALALAVFLVLSFVRESVFDKLVYRVPLFSAIVALLAAYDLLTLKYGVLPMPYFPWVDQIILAILSDYGMLLNCIYHSLILLFTGYLIGAAVGLVSGVGAGWSKTVNYWVAPLLRVLGPIPSLTWLSIVLIIFPSLFSGSVFIIALGTWYPVAMSSLTGIANVPVSNFEAARTFGVSRLGLIFKVGLPSAMPSIFTGLTQGMGVACAALIAAEMLGVEAGLGWYINWQRGWADFAKVYAAVLAICLTFLAVSWLLNRIKRHTLKWQVK